jgi:hypothetical protein
VPRQRPKVVDAIALGVETVKHGSPQFGSPRLDLLKAILALLEPPRPVAGPYRILLI